MFPCWLPPVNLESDTASAGRVGWIHEFADGIENKAEMLITLFL
jgi:hypothetical protein